MPQSLEVAGISFDLIIIRIWRGTSTEQTQAFAQTVAQPAKIDVMPSARASSSHATAECAAQLEGGLELQATGGRVAIDGDSKRGVWLES